MEQAGDATAVSLDLIETDPMSETVPRSETDPRSEDSSVPETKGDDLSSSKLSISNSPIIGPSIKSKAGSTKTESKICPEISLSCDDNIWTTIISISVKKGFFIVLLYGIDQVGLFMVFMQ